MYIPFITPQNHQPVRVFQKGHAAPVVSGGPGQASGESALAAFAADGVDLIDEDDGGSLGQQTMDWFKGKPTGNHGFYHQI